MNNMTLADELKLRRKILAKNEINQTILCPADQKKTLGVGLTSDFTVFSCPFNSKKAKQFEKTDKIGGEIHLETKILNSSESFARQINGMIKADVQASTFQCAASASFLNKVNRQSNSVYFNIFDSRLNENKEVLQSEKLSKAALKLLKNHQYQTFLSLYGTHYVSEIIYQAVFFGKLEIHTEKSQDKNEASLALSGTYKADKNQIKVDAAGSLKLKQVLSKSQTNCSMEVLGININETAPQNLQQLWQRYQLFVDQFKKQDGIKGKETVFICKPFYKLFLSFPGYNKKKIDQAYQKINDQIQQEVIKDLKVSIKMSRNLRACIIIQTVPQPQRVSIFLEELSKQSRINNDLKNQLTLLVKYLMGYSNTSYDLAQNFFPEIVSKINQVLIDESCWYKICSHKNTNYKWSVMGEEGNPIRIFDNSNGQQQKLFFEKFGFKTVNFENKQYKKIFYLGQPQKCLQSKKDCGFSIVESSNSKAQIFKLQQVRIKAGTGTEDDVSYILSPQQTPFSCIDIKFQEGENLKQGLDLYLKSKRDQSSGNLSQRWKLIKCEKMN